MMTTATLTPPDAPLPAGRFANAAVGNAGLRHETARHAPTPHRGGTGRHTPGRDPHGPAVRPAHPSPADTPARCPTQASVQPNSAEFKMIFVAASAASGLPQGPDVLKLAPTDDAESAPLDGVAAVHLWFDRFTDGRAYSQAVALRRRGWTGPVVATGDVVADQALQLARCGFSHAVLRADQSLTVAHRQLRHFAALPHWYQANPAAA